MTTRGPVAADHCIVGEVYWINRTWCLDARSAQMVLIVAGISGQSQHRNEYRSNRVLWDNAYSGVASVWISETNAVLTSESDFSKSHKNIEIKVFFSFFEGGGG